MRKYLWLIATAALVVIILLMQFVYLDALQRNFHQDPSGLFMSVLLPGIVHYWKRPVKNTGKSSPTTKEVPDAITR